MILFPIVTHDSYTGFSSPSRAGCIAGEVFLTGKIETPVLLRLTHRPRSEPASCCDLYLVPLLGSSGPVRRPLSDSCLPACSQPSPVSCLWVTSCTSCLFLCRCPLVFLIPFPCPSCAQLLSNLLHFHEQCLNDLLVSLHLLFVAPPFCLFPPPAQCSPL